MPSRRLHLLMSRCGVRHSVRSYPWLHTDHHSSSHRGCPDLPTRTSECSTRWRWRIYVCVVPPWTLLSRWDTHSLPGELLAQSRYRHNDTKAEQPEQLHTLPRLRSAMLYRRRACGPVRLLDGESKRLRRVSLPVATRLCGRSCSLCRCVVYKRPQRCALRSM